MPLWYLVSKDSPIQCHSWHAPLPIKKWSLCRLPLNLVCDCFVRYNGEEVTNWDFLAQVLKRLYSFYFFHFVDLNCHAQSLSHPLGDRGHEEKPWRFRHHLNRSHIAPIFNPQPQLTPTAGETPSETTRRTAHLSPSQPMELWDTTKWYLFQDTYFWSNWLCSNR